MTEVVASFNPIEALKVKYLLNVSWIDCILIEFGSLFVAISRYFCPYLAINFLLELVLSVFVYVLSDAAASECITKNANNVLLSIVICVVYQFFMSLSTDLLIEYDV